MTIYESAGPTVDPSQFRSPDEPYAGHWREFPAAWPSPEEEETSDTRLLVAEALAQLPERQRAVIRLRDVEGHTAADVCSILNISTREERLLLHRARASVRARLAEYFSTRRLTLGPETDPDAT